MPIYEWENTETGEIVDHIHYNRPPELPGAWKRVFSIGIGKVSGAGEAPSRQTSRT